ncbi:MAG: GxxExxY protein [Xenococcaceae cyanobacterium MO_188.B32]|nr:GxxExxY protein [Xenococcaceae cyanobacterium MO_188.B32]
MGKNFREESGDLTGAVIGAAIEVHRVLGAGFLESVYESALAVELRSKNISFERQKIISVTYKGHPVGEGRLDFLIENILIVELKAVTTLTPLHEAQVLSYLKATNCNLALLINFNVTRLTNGIKRIIRST